jgi:hypothetical protein
MNHLYLRVIVPLAITLPLFFAFLNTRFATRADRQLRLYLLVSAFTNLVAAIVSGMLHSNNLPLLHGFTAIEFVLLTTFYKHIFREEHKRMQYITLQGVFVLFCIANAILLQPLKTYNSYARSLEAILLMLFSIRFFAKQFVEGSGAKLVRKSAFWFNTGIFLYFSWSLMFFIFSNMIVPVSKRNGNFLLYMHASFVLIMYLLFSVGFARLQDRKRLVPAKG